jgi:hopanoid biosynthesis associated protein HpnK
VKQLIVNADDFGYTRGVNRAIVEGYRNGIITSTSLMANGAAFEDAVERAQGEPGLDVGCHLNLVEGAPVSLPETVPHLVGADGRFHRLPSLALRLAGGLVPAAELERECSAQIEKLLRAGIVPNHLDTHQHTHIHPRVAAVVARVAQRFAIGWIRRPFEKFWPSGTGESLLRKLVGGSLTLLASGFDRRMAAEGIRTADFFTGFRLTGRWTPGAMEETVRLLQPGITELMCHPGFYDAELEASPTRLKRERQIEHQIVAQPGWRTRIEAAGVVLRGFRGIAAPALAARDGLLAAAAPLQGE